MPTAVVGTLGRRGIAAFPGYSVFIVPWAGHKSSVNAFTRDQGSGQLGGGRAYTADLLNSEVAWDVWLDSGTYKVAYVYQSASNYGIATFLLNGVSVGTIDQYAAAGAFNNYSEITAIAVAAGLKTLTVRAASRHASSTGYFLPMNSIAIIRTGA